MKFTLNNKTIKNINKIVDKRKDELIAFLREMIKTPSLSGHEKDVAELMAEKMREVGFDKIQIDEFNDVIGIIKGEGTGENVLFNGHLDHVPPGDMEDPFSGKIMNGSKFGLDGKVIYGRGACDMKGALAAMVMAGATLKEINVKTKGDIYITASVMEEKGGSLGTKAIIERKDIQPKIAVIGEATNLNIAIGHRGTAYIEVIVCGKSSHASNPNAGINAIYKATKIIDEIQGITPRLPVHPILGRTLVNVTNIFAKPGSVNVIPYECCLQIDARFIPEFTNEDIIRFIEKIISDLKHIDPNLDAGVRIATGKLHLPSGEVKIYQELMPPLFTDPNENVIQKSVQVVRSVAGINPKVTVWNFATDGGWFSKAGMITFGLGPGDEKFAHTSQENISVTQVLMATKIYSILACILSEKVNS
jgi:putative selenium metabolism hydrolase